MKKILIKIDIYALCICLTIFFAQLSYANNLEVDSFTNSSSCVAKLKNKVYPCVLGKNGTKKDKKEGDGATPLGEFLFRRVYFREDRIGNKLNNLKIPIQKLKKDDGWCDDISSTFYNKYIKLPFEGSHENLWRTDSLYDIIVVIGHNDNPVVKEKGSAIFLHIKSTETKYTAGCIAFSEKDLIEILNNIEDNSKIIIK